MRPLLAFVAGLVFGLGLLVSGMADPAKVLGFLDLAGAWNPSLALVMAGAIAVGIVAFALARRRTTGLLGDAMQLPATRTIDRRLVVGGLLFGVGWGLAGFCPGPSLVALGMGETKAMVFVLAMLAGMGVFELANARRVPRASTPQPPSVPPSISEQSAPRALHARLLRKHDGRPDDAASQAELLALLRRAPGVTDVAQVERHPRGGFQVRLTLAWSSFDDCFAYLDANGWMGAL